MKMKHMLLVLVVVMVGFGVNQGMSASKSVWKTVFFVAYELAWIILIATCWTFLDELEEKNWRRAHGIE